MGSFVSFYFISRSVKLYLTENLCNLENKYSQSIVAQSVLEKSLNTGIKLSQ